MRRVAVLGGALSGLECARRLAESGHEVHLFRRLHDPSRSFRDLHPIYEFSPASIAIPDNAPLLNGAVERWLRDGIVVTDDKHVLAKCIVEKNGHVELLIEESTRRVRPACGGFFDLLEDIVRTLSPGVSDRSEIVTSLRRGASGSWEPKGLEEHQCLGDFDLVVCAYDYFLRATRKAALRAILENSLPTSAAVMSSVAGAQDGVAFAAIVKVVAGTPPIPFDELLVQGLPELALAMRNRGDSRRGLPDDETWTLVASPAWTEAIRPDATSRWDKAEVARRMLAAFARVNGGSQARTLRPVYHWGGFSSLTKSQNASCAYDSQARLCFVGDFFVGHGADAAMCSGSSLAAQLSFPESLLPSGTEFQWIPRSPEPNAEGIAALFGNPQATEDHAWPTVQQLASGTLAPGNRCMDRYRRRRVLEQDLMWQNGVAGKASGRGSPAPSAAAAAGGQMGVSGKGSSLRGARWRRSAAPS